MIIQQLYRFIFYSLFCGIIYLQPFCIGAEQYDCNIQETGTTVIDGNKQVNSLVCKGFFTVQSIGPRQYALKLTGIAVAANGDEEMRFLAAKDYSKTRIVLSIATNATQIEIYDNEVLIARGTSYDDLKATTDSAKPESCAAIALSSYILRIFPVFDAPVTMDDKDKEYRSTLSGKPRKDADTANHKHFDSTEYWTLFKLKDTATKIVDPQKSIHLISIQNAAPKNENEDEKKEPAENGDGKKDSVENGDKEKEPDEDGAEKKDFVSWKCDTEVTPEHNIPSLVNGTRKVSMLIPEKHAAIVSVTDILIKKADGNGGGKVDEKE